MVEFWKVFQTVSIYIAVIFVIASFLMAFSKIFTDSIKDETWEIRKNNEDDGFYKETEYESIRSRMNRESGQSRLYRFYDDDDDEDD